MLFAFRPLYGIYTQMSEAYNAITMNTPQSTSAVLMVQPLSFGFNEQTAITNTFQNRPAIDDHELHARANQEFATMVDGLRLHGIHVTVFDDPDTSQPKPDAVFPNNWFSAWPDGTIYLYPMATQSRRTERSYHAVAELSNNFAITRVHDISATENFGMHLESTGVMIFDHQHKIAYGCISPRCDASLFASHALQLGYKPVLFHAFDTAGAAIYHTNVLMGVQSSTAVICAEAISDTSERQAVLTSLEQTGHAVVQITQEQMTAFCGNVLELTNATGEKFLAMSQTAYDAFTPEQRTLLSQDKTLLPFDVSTIETVGGGSVRCMLGEVFLPKLVKTTPSVPLAEALSQQTQTQTAV